MAISFMLPADGQKDLGAAKFAEATTAFDQAL
jgi:hypothetical protein